MTEVAGFTSKNKQHISYPNLPSAMRPVLHSDDLEVPVPPQCWTMDEDDSESLDGGEVRQDSDKDFSDQSDGPHLINQSELNDLVRDLNLSKLQAELLGSRLQKWNLLHQDTRISLRTRHASLLPFFKMEGDRATAVTSMVFS
jgi:hypothetical protein